MARRGYAVTMYDKSDVPGGMLRHAIPDYRLPRAVLDAEVQRILDLNIALVRNVDVGSDIGFHELRDRHTLMFLGLGAQAPRALGIPGEEGPGVISGLSYLRQRKRRIQSQRDTRVIVIGGGNTAIDAARTARREGANVTLLYRRSELEMPAAADEIQDARTEGVEFRFLVSPTRVIREGSAIRGIELQAMRLGDADEEGRRRPVPIPGHIDELPADTVIVAVSQAPDWHGMETLRDTHKWLRTEEDGKLEDNIWAGGDDRGPGIASQAIAQGRLAAEAAHAELRGEPRPAHGQTHSAVRPGVVKTDYYLDRQRTSAPRRPQEEWLADSELEIDQTISNEQACREAARCMSCGMCFDCQQCFMYCNAGGFTRIEETRPGHYFALALDACEGCGKCVEICPCGYLESRDGAIW
jgi:formate dehydrogenase major subunit